MATKKDEPFVRIDFGIGGRKESIELSENQFFKLLDDVGVCPECYGPKGEMGRLCSICNGPKLN